MTLNINELTGVQRELRAFLQRLGAVGIPFGTPVNAVASTSTLSVALNPALGETFTIGTKVYEFVAAAAAEGEITLEALVADTRLNIVAAINGLDGINTASADVTAAAFAGNDSTLTAIVRGVVGDSIATAETMAGAGNGITAMAGGVDGTPGVQGAVCADATRIYVCIANNTIAGANWRRTPAAAALEAF